MLRGNHWYGGIGGVSELRLSRLGCALGGGSWADDFVVTVTCDAAKQHFMNSHLARNVSDGILSSVVDEGGWPRRESSRVE